MNGWVKLHRKLLDWEWYNDSKMVHLFIHMLLKANHEKHKWRGIDVLPGQFISGRITLSEETGISQRSIRTIIKRLKATSEVTIKSTNKYSLFTLNNWINYQNENEATNKVTSKRPASDQQPTTNKNEKNKKNEKNLDARALIFKKSLIDRIPDFSVEMVKAFYDYWSEPNKSKTKMKFELQQTWDLKRRLNTWASRDKNFNAKEPEKESYE